VPTPKRTFSAVANYLSYTNNKREEQAVKTEKAKTYTQEEVDAMIAKAIKQDREFCGQVLRSLPFGDAEIKQGWIENPKPLNPVLTETLYPPKKEKKPAEHLYAFKIRKDGANAEALQKRMDGTFYVSDNAKAMMGKPEFTIGATEDVGIRVYRVDALGVTGWSETKFFGPEGWKHLKTLGLAPCLPDDAPYIRIVHDTQKLDEWIRVAHDPISARAYSLIFNVGHYSDDGRYLGGRDLRSGCKLRADGLVAVRVASQN
jgi:hypothetical protein